MDPLQNTAKDEIKDENADKFERFTEQILSLEVVKMEKLEHNSICGEVLFVGNDQFILICTLCRHPSKSWILFENHIRELHCDSEPEPEINLDIKNEAQSALDKSKLDMTESNSCDSDEDVASELPLMISMEDASEESQSSNSQDDKDVDPTIQSRKPEQVSADSDPLAKGTRNRSNVMRKFRCPKCDCSYSYKRSLRKHIRASHGQEYLPPTRRDRYCRYCCAVFENFEQLQAHKAANHQGDAKYACPHCDQLFRTHTGRQVHISSHTGERPYKCPHCPSDFNVSSNLKKHIHSHLNIRLYACKFCDKTFVQSNERNVHQRRHTGEKPYQCEQCGIGFFTRTLLARHSKRHSDVRDFKCDQCPKAFYDAATLKGHRLVHTSERPFKCTVCDKSFARQKGLKQHSYIHLEVKQFMCATCGKEFAQLSGLKSHEKIH